MITKPTKEQAEHFMKCLQKVPSEYFSDHKDKMSADYGTCFSSYYIMVDWLDKEFGLR